MSETRLHSVRGPGDLNKEEQSTLHVFPSPGDAGRSQAMIAGWAVDDLEAVVDELTVDGVAFERYDGPPITTDEKGIAVLGASKAAWFRDPDGNMLLN